MKIPSKKVIDTQIALERKNSIDEGVRIASKVDTLRRTLGELELQHTKFVENIKTNLQHETNGLISNIEHLKNEVKILEEKRNILLVPLNQEWENVKIKTKEILDYKKEIDSIANSLSIKQKTIEERDKKTKETISKINIREHELDRVYNNVLSLKEETENIKHDFEAYKLSKEKEILERERLLDIKELENKNTFIANEHFMELLKDREIKLNEREIRLISREGTLERTINRLKK